MPLDPLEALQSTPKPKAALSWASLRPKQRKFIDCYLTTAHLNATQAAREAGYGSPETLGPRLLGKLRPLIAEQEQKLRESALMSPREVMEGLTTEAKSAESRPGDRIKALEILARIHGMLSEKLQVSVDVPAARAAVIGALSELRAQALQQPVEAEIVLEQEQPKQLPSGHE